VKKISLNTLIKRIRLVVLDVDGVLTDGTIHVSGAGDELKTFHVHDGSGIKYLQRAGIEVAILSGRTARAVNRRAAELGIRHVLQGYHVKADGLDKLLKATRVATEQVCFMGDDLPDIPVMRKVGLAVSVPNGRPEVRRIAHWVTRARGGRGAVRELAEKILRGQALWGRIVARYGLRGKGGAAGGAL